MNFNTVRSVHDGTCTRLKTEYTVQPETVLAQDWRPSTPCNQWRYSHKTEDRVHCAPREGTRTRLKTEYTVQPETVLAQDRRPSTLCNQWRYLHKTEDRVHCPPRDGSRTRLKTEYIVQPETVLAQDWRPRTLCNQRRFLHKTEDRVHCAISDDTYTRPKTEYTVCPETGLAQDWRLRTVCKAYMSRSWFIVLYWMNVMVSTCINESQNFDWGCRNLFQRNYFPSLSFIWKFLGLSRESQSSVQVLRSTWEVLIDYRISNIMWSLLQRLKFVRFEEMHGNSSRF